jgi:hypothetical protein
MLILQDKKDGSGIIKFSWKEKLTILFKGKLILSPEFLRRFGNDLVMIVGEWHIHFNEDTRKIINKENEEIKTK